MNYRNLLIIIFICTVFLTGCVTKQVTVEKISTSMSDDKGSASAVSGKEMTEKAAMTDQETTSDSPYHGEVLAGSVTPYLDFNKADYDQAIKENKIILLNFYANWCPICRAEQPKIFAAFNQLNYPVVVGFRVNYRDSDVDDFEEDLAREHGITYQHTKVIIKDGKRILKAPDSWSTERYLEEIGRVV